MSRGDVTSELVKISPIPLFILEPFTVQIACGPFSTCDETLSYKPLDDLLSTVAKDAPDVLILVNQISYIFIQNSIPHRISLVQ